MRDTQNILNGMSYLSLRVKCTCSFLKIVTKSGKMGSVNNVLVKKQLNRDAS